MKFVLLDRIIEQTADRIVAVKHVSLAEEYLADHFPGYPVLPGVMMVEAMVQAARRMLTDAAGDGRLVLGEVRALKFGSMVRPGEALEVEVRLLKELEGSRYLCQGTGIVRGDERTTARAGETAVSGRFTMRPVHSG
jgi:3-hydroxyacyl-[acyl-carrier-protein] dehydratase